MSSLQFSGIGSVIASGTPAATGANDPAGPPAANRGQSATALRNTATGSSGNESGVPSTQTANSAAPPLASQSSQAIGTQLVLVFDDRTRSMQVKLLDIRTQKVDQTLLPDAAATDAAVAPTETFSGSAHVDTKA